MNVLSLFDGMSCGQIALDGMINRERVNAEKGNGFGARLVSPEGKANTLCVYHENLDHNLIAGRTGKPIGITEALQSGSTLRRLTPVECARLQTVPVWYEWVVSDTQIYRMCGNGWTVRVIEHILKNLFV